MCTHIRLAAVPSITQFKTATLKRVNYRPTTGKVRISVEPDKPVPQQFKLQDRAHGNVRMHALRASVRVCILAITDGVATVVAAVLALTFLNSLSPTVPLVHGIREVLPVGTANPVEATTAVLVGIFLSGSYRAGDRRRDPAALYAGTGLGLMLLFWTAMWSDFQRVAFVAVMSTLWIGSAVVVGRFVLDVVVRKRRAVDQSARRILLVGTSSEVKQLQARSHPIWKSLSQVGFVDVSSIRAAGSLGGIADLPEIIHSKAVDTVLLCGPMNDAVLAEVMRLSDSAGCRVTSLSRSFSLNGLEPQVTWHGGIPLVELTRPSLRGSHLILKRLFDIAVSAFIITLMSPVLLVVAIAVRLSSPGAMIFKQQRVGYGGHLFNIYKFRSMYIDAEARLAELQSKSVYSDPRLFKIKNDPRITRVGAFLRKTSLDEFPQLFNVLRGDMSLVGPRPPLPGEVAHYEEKLLNRFDMKPGVTGPWQVSGRNRITSFDEVMRIETTYMRGWTIWRDFLILLKTVPAVLKMDGAH